MSTLPYAATPATVSVPTGSARYQVLIGALLVQLILGTVYGYSIFWEPLDRTVWPQMMTQARAAELTAAGTPVATDVVVLSDEAALKREQAERLGNLTYSFSICLLAFAITMIFAGRLQDIIGPRWTAMIGGILMGAGFLISGQVDHLPAGTSRLALLWATIGLVAGMGIGFAYVCPIAALVKWFPQHKGLMSGIAVAGFGFGAYVFSQKNTIGAAGFIQSHGILPLFNVHAIICMAAIGLGAMLLRNPPPGYAGAAKKAVADGADLTWRQTVRTGRFYIIWLMFLSGAMAGLMVIGIIKPFAGEQLVDAAKAAGAALGETDRAKLMLQGTTAVGVLAIFNAIGRIFWGLASDKIGRTLALMLMFTLQGITLLSLTALDSTAQLALGAACVGFNFGGCFALFPSLTADLFGSRNIGANYGWVFTSYGVAGVIGMAAGKMAKTRMDSYFAAFALAAGLCFLSGILALALARTLKRQKAAV